MKLRLRDESGGEPQAIELRGSGSEFELVVGERHHAATVLEREGTRLTFLLDGSTHRAHVLVTDDEVWVTMNGVQARFSRVEREASSRGTGAHSERRVADPLVRAAVPGKVLKLVAGAGDNVSAGDPLVVIEAMKMEHAVAAEANGTVQAVHVTEGEMVKVGDLLVTCDWQPTPPAG
jgi:biotin carboxyl carrier protein